MDAVLVPPDPAQEVSDAVDNVCTPEHCFQAFDTLFCALTAAKPIEPKFPDEK